MESRYSSVIGVMELKINSQTTLLLSFPPFTLSAHHHSLSHTVSWNISHVLVLHSSIFQRHYKISSVGTSPNTGQKEACSVKMKTQHHINYEAKYSFFVSPKASLNICNYLNIKYNIFLVIGSCWHIVSG